MPSELSVSSPTIYGVATYPPGATFGPRRMNEFEFVWMIEGDAEYRWDQEAVAAPAGSLVLCRPGAVDFFRWDVRQRTRHGFIHFHLLDLPSDWPPQGEWPLVRFPAADDILHPLFRYVLTWAGRGHELQCRLAVASMLAAFVTGEMAAEEVPHAPWPEAVERAWSHIHRCLEENPARAIGLSELAQVACVTPEHLCRLFKAHTGHTPVETVRYARLDQAVILLSRSNYSVREIAEICGFTSPFHFSRRFKEAFHRAPTALRKAVQSGDTPPTPLLLQLNRRISSDA